MSCNKLFIFLCLGILVPEYVITQHQNVNTSSEEYSILHPCDSSARKIALGEHPCDPAGTTEESQILNSCTLSTSINPKSVDIVSIYDFLPTHPEIGYVKSHDQIPFLFEPFPLSVLQDSQPYQGSFNETFILSIPQGTAYSFAGWTVVDNCLIKELIWKNKALGLRHFNQANFNNPTKYPGKVAVITLRGANCYFHWISEVLGRLALLEMNGIEYDWLYVSTSKPFMKDSLALWGIDPAKIIEPSDENTCIQADELIVPSMISKINAGYTRFASYAPEYILRYVQEKLTRSVQLDSMKLNPSIHQEKQFSQRVFISRKDTSIRQMSNEDEVFALFEAQGFERYCLSKLSIQEQIQLFSNAQIIVGCHGAGLTNIIFCKPETLIIELFQARGSATYWYISQMLGLNHKCVPTTNFDTTTNGFRDTHVPLSIVQDILKHL